MLRSLRVTGPELGCALRCARTRSMSTAPDELLYESVGPARIVTLNRPKALNALNQNMVRQFYPRLSEWNLASDVGLVIVKGSGEKAFCAGGDVLAVTKSAKDAEAGGQSVVHKEFFREEYQLNHLIGNLTKPYVALIDGIVMGGGCGLSINGRFRVSTERTMLAMPETALGLFPDVGGSYFLSRLRDNLGMFLALTGYRLKGADTYHSGLATHYVNSSELPAVEKQLASLPEISDDSVNTAIRSFTPTTIPPFSLEKELPRIKDLFHGRRIEDIIENLKKDGSDWSKKQLDILSKMIFTMEYRLTQRFMADHDFHEGCRAILIDKCRNPRWNPATLDEVDDEHIDRYFAPLPHTQELILHEDD